MKICLDAGHYAKYNRSPVNRAYYESEMNWKLHLMLKAELERYGIEVITTRPQQAKDLGLTNRGRCAKGCELFLSMHSNATANGATSPDYPIVYGQISGKGDALAARLAERIAQVMGTKQEGRVGHRKGNNGDYYGVLRGAASVGVTALLIEHSFHTNPRSTAWLLDDENLTALAKAEAAVIAEYYGLPLQDASDCTESVFAPYKVKVLDDALNIRKTPKWGDEDIVGVITDHGVYTIVEETMLGRTRFGRLKSGAGWISLGKKYVRAWLPQSGRC